MRKPKLPIATALEGAGYLLEAAVRVGLVSGAAVAAFIGQFVLAAVLGVIALGMFIRLWRGRVPK
jgi:hypothetical protein